MPSLHQCSRNPIPSKHLASKLEKSCCFSSDRFVLQQLSLQRCQCQQGTRAGERRVVGCPLDLPRVPPARRGSPSCPYVSPFFLQAVAQPHGDPGGGLSSWEGFFAKFREFPLRPLQQQHAHLCQEVFQSHLGSYTELLPGYLNTHLLP